MFSTISSDLVSGLLWPWSDCKYKLVWACVNSFPDSGHFCCLLITFANNLDSNQAGQNVGPDLDPNCLTLWWYSWKIFLKKVNFKNNKSTDNKKAHVQNYTACRELTMLEKGLFSHVLVLHFTSTTPFFHNMFHFLLLDFHVKTGTRFSLPDKRLFQMR